MDNRKMDGLSCLLEPFKRFYVDFFTRIAVLLVRNDNDRCNTLRGSYISYWHKASRGKNSRNCEVS